MTPRGAGQLGLHLVDTELLALVIGAAFGVAAAIFLIFLGTGPVNTSILWFEVSAT